ncbi:oxidoreductase [Mycobacteroides salmoniphilum]|uniref:Uncharacterized protein n=1 Tax=Mycobacteroides salmoniphilum TaxID=404941 RepID=A0A4R8SDR9_9MYCO|nr:oxidoreductase [Mycobacteroides salmoniphilum]TDZ93593.1 hypothetical protein CCUG60885_03196 [Mycobacteroides salmoniphilum]TEA09376.1 hypothetical protein CCUG60883_00137 [Mycobacteroides salmoniphilum]
MAWIDAFRSKRGGQTTQGTNDDVRYLATWAAARTGVEAYVEPQTNFSDVTVILIAGDGEWTRRRVGGVAGARRISERLKIPVYDVHRTGYPQRKRDYDARQRILKRRAAEEGA